MFDALLFGMHQAQQTFHEARTKGQDGNQHRYPAEAELARTQRSQATLSYALAVGRPKLLPEMPVAVSGFKPEIDETP